MTGRWEIAPHAALRPFVRAYWFLDREAMAQPFAVMPDCFVELLVFAQPPAMCLPEGDRRLPRSFVVPLLDESILLRFDHPIRCAAIRFYGWSAVVLGTANAAGGWCETPEIFAHEVACAAAALERGAWPDVAAIFDRMLATFFCPERATARRPRARARLSLDARDRRSVCAWFRAGSRPLAAANRTARARLDLALAQSARLPRTLPIRARRALEAARDPALHACKRRRVCGSGASLARIPALFGHDARGIQT